MSRVGAPAPGAANRAGAEIPRAPRRFIGASPAEDRETQQGQRTSKFTWAITIRSAIKATLTDYMGRLDLD
jgi:hypothetical protein